MKSSALEAQRRPSNGSGPLANAHLSSHNYNRTRMVSRFSATS